jgi:hypothetical protein
VETARIPEGQHVLSQFTGDAYNCPTPLYGTLLMHLETLHQLTLHGIWLRNEIITPVLDIHFLQVYTLNMMVFPVYFSLHYGAATLFVTLGISFLTAGLFSSAKFLRNPVNVRHTGAKAYRQTEMYCMQL